MLELVELSRDVDSVDIYVLPEGRSFLQIIGRRPRTFLKTEGPIYPIQVFNACIVADIFIIFFLNPSNILVKKPNAFIRVQSGISAQRQGLNIYSTQGRW